MSRLFELICRATKLGERVSFQAEGSSLAKQGGYRHHWETLSGLSIDSRSPEDIQEQAVIDWLRCKHPDSPNSPTAFEEPRTMRPSGKPSLFDLQQGLALAGYTTEVTQDVMRVWQVEGNLKVPKGVIDLHQTSPGPKVPCSEEEVADRLSEFVLRQLGLEIIPRVEINDGVAMAEGESHTATVMITPVQPKTTMSPPVEDPEFSEKAKTLGEENARLKNVEHNLRAEIESLNRRFELVNTSDQKRRKENESLRKHVKGMEKRLAELRPLQILHDMLVTPLNKVQKEVGELRSWMELLDDREERVDPQD